MYIVLVHPILFSKEKNINLCDPGGSNSTLIFPYNRAAIKLNLHVHADNPEKKTPLSRNL